MNAISCESIEKAIIASLHFILTNQSENGSWIDWQLPPGKSDAWTTAYIGYKLRLIPSFLADNVKSKKSAASEWILRNEYSEGGWGYNKLVGSDADSTAYSILFLVSEGKTVPIRCYRVLKEFQSLDGGFSTYKPRDKVDSWRVSHPDVSPIALLALGTKYSQKANFMKRGIDYIIRQRTSNGMWNSFWWDSNIYSVEANLSFLNSIDVQLDDKTMIKCLLRLEPKIAFEKSLLISCILFIDKKLGEEKITTLVEQLVLEQRLDGSWTSEPILRVTKNNCFKPWNCKDSGIVYSDPNRLFTTSTVLESLCRVYRHSLASRNE